MTETRLVALDFETGRISAWVKVPGGVAHRIAVLGPYDTKAMREWPFDRDQIEKLRVNPAWFLAGQRHIPQDDGPEAA